MNYWKFDSPLGPLLLVGEERALQALHLPGLHKPRAGWVEAAAPFEDAVAQLEEYFAGERREFDLPLDPLAGNAFDRAVWSRLSQIPYGETVTYGQVAKDIGHPADARAVGGANARNPIGIIVPCHRVIGSDGSLTGYAGGLELKRDLLALESGVQTLL